MVETFSHVLRYMVHLIMRTGSHNIFVDIKEGVNLCLSRTTLQTRDQEVFSHRLRFYGPFKVEHSTKCDSSNISRSHLEPEILCKVPLK